LYKGEEILLPMDYSDGEKRETVGREEVVAVIHLGGS